MAKGLEPERMVVDREHRSIFWRSVSPWACRPVCGRGRPTQLQSDTSENTTVHKLRCSTLLQARTTAPPLTSTGIFSSGRWAGPMTTRAFFGSKIEPWQGQASCPFL